MLLVQINQTSATMEMEVIHVVINYILETKQLNTHNYLSFTPHH
jgi:hypothetical protein